MTAQEIDEFRAWHTARLNELGYPLELVNELTAARERWLGGVKRDRLGTHCAVLSDVPGSSWDTHEEGHQNIRLDGNVWYSPNGSSWWDSALVFPVDPVGRHTRHSKP